MADSFIFYRSFREALKYLDVESRCKIYDALCDYALDGDDITLVGVERAVFELMRPIIETNEKRRNAGKMGGDQKQANAKQKDSNNIANSSKAVANSSNGVASPSIATTLLDHVDKDIDKDKDVDKDVDADGDIKPSDGPVQEVISLSESRFNKFWELYPRKEGKGAAKAKFIKLNPNKELFDKIMSSVQDNIDRNPQWQKQNGQFIPHPTTWLNQGRWDDDIGTIEHEDWFTRELRKTGGMPFE